MRNLTIKREKSFVACLMKIKVYIEDHTSNEITINNIPCRKIGEIKNGEEKTFSIDEKETKVFVIADKLSKDYCNDFYKIPAGTSDIFLTGKNKFSLSSGNAFRFNGVTDEEVLRNRVKGTKKGSNVMLLSIIIGLIVGLIIGFGLI